MGIDPKDNDVTQLIKKLKDANGAYPQDLLALRRQMYLRQVAEISGAAGLSMGLKNAAKGGKAVSSLSSTTGMLLEGLLVVAIVAEASTVAYFYRDKISQFVRNLTNQPKVEEVADPLVIPSPLSQIPTALASPVATGTETDTATPIGTPSVMAGQPTGASSGTSAGTTSGGGSQAVATAQPDDKNGNQYGLTPKPERTKDPGSNNQDLPEESKKGK